jgi:hypothetical protein
VRLALIERLASALNCSAAWLAFGLEIPRAELRKCDAVVLRMDSEDWNERNGPAIERFVDDIRREAPGRPVIVMPPADIEVMPEEEARRLGATDLSEFKRQLSCTPKNDG